MSTETQSGTAVTSARRIGRLEPAALAGVMSRDVVDLRSLLEGRRRSPRWCSRRSTCSRSGSGFRSLVPYVGHVKYVEYLATGVVATAVLFSSAFPGMFNTFVRWQFQRTYDAMLAAPVDVEELITAEVLWISLRAGVYGLAPLIVGMAFGLEPQAGMLLVVPIGFVTGFGFAAFGVTVAAIAKTIDNFNYITSAVLTPMFLVAGTFFPISKLPAGIRTIAQLNPLYHCVQLVRDASLGELSTADLGHAAVLVGFALLMWRLAVLAARQAPDRLIRLHTEL